MLTIFSILADSLPLNHCQTSFSPYSIALLLLTYLVNGITVRMRLKRSNISNLLSIFTRLIQDQSHFLKVLLGSSLL